MDVVRHATIDRTTQSVAEHRMRQEFTELVVENRNQPAGFSVLHCHRPMDVGLSAIMLGGQAPEIVMKFRFFVHCALGLIGVAEIARVQTIWLWSSTLPSAEVWRLQLLFESNP